ncbi:hypothetical protein A5764_02875 [Mycobacterium sp. 852002-51057_SCH5723018]|nr:hypothetical protein A5764_02875 [Mycobacterium sp. 852002-51057_SCH5723018]
MDAGTGHCAETVPARRRLTNNDLLLSRPDGTRWPVRDYSREFTAQHKVAGLTAITLGARPTHWLSQVNRINRSDID